jgi:hypothetical protein
MPAAWEQYMFSSACSRLLLGCSLLLSLSIQAVPETLPSAGTPATSASNGSTASGPAYHLQKYVSTDPAFLLYKPNDWAVTPRNSASTFEISVANPAGTSRVGISFVDNRQARLNSTGLLIAKIREIKAQHPDLTPSEVQVCKDPAASCAVATVTYTANHVTIKGRVFCHADAQQAVTRSYMAPKAELQNRRLLLLDILTNIHILKSPGPGGRAQPAAPPPAQLVSRHAPDGSLTVSTPLDWNFQGAGGMAVAIAPSGGAGFMFTTFQVMPPNNYGVPPAGNVILSRYEPPSQFIIRIFGKFGNRDVHVLHVEPDPASAAACPQYIGRRCEAADVQLSWVSPKGASCIGSFKVLNASPSILGQWFSIVSGIWGPANNLANYLPTLEQVAASFTINDRYAKGYIQQGVIHLRELEAETHASMRGLYQAIDDNQAAYERRQAIKDNSDAKWDDYRRGNSYWISDLEGGKVYQTDPWGTEDRTTGDRIEGAPYDYIHFEGQNPRYPSENMHEVSSYELQQMMGAPRR